MTWECQKPRRFTVVAFAAALAELSACGSSPTQRPAPIDAAPTAADASPREKKMSRQEMVDEAKRLLRAGDTRGAVTLLSRVENLESADPARAWYAAHYLATAQIAAGDLLAASRILDDALARLPPADTQTRFWVHSGRVWVRWGLRDLEGALTAVAAMQDTTTAWPVADRNDGLLHVYWDRAYLHLDLAGREKNRSKRRALRAEADRWRHEYEAAAEPREAHAIGRATIAVHFALADGDVKAADTLARTIDEKKADPQDLFIAARAALAVGDVDRARALRERISTEPTVMAALIARELDELLVAGRTGDQEGGSEAGTRLVIQPTP